MESIVTQNGSTGTKEIRSRGSYPSIGTVIALVTGKGINGMLTKRLLVRQQVLNLPAIGLKRGHAAIGACEVTGRIRDISSIIGIDEIGLVAKRTVYQRGTVAVNVHAVVQSFYIGQIGTDISDHPRAGVFLHVVIIQTRTVSITPVRINQVRRCGITIQDTEGLILPFVRIRCTHRGLSHIGRRTGIIP